MQVHGGMGYSRYKPFEHIYRHHRRYRITEGADEIQMRRVGRLPVRLHEAAEAQGRQLMSMPRETIRGAARGIHTLPGSWTGFHSLWPASN